MKTVVNKLGQQCHLPYITILPCTWLKFGIKKLEILGLTVQLVNGNDF